MSSVTPFSYNPLSAVKDLNRFREIITVLARHGFGQLVTELVRGENAIAKALGSFRVEPSGFVEESTTLAVRGRLVFQDLGPTFIKLGQILSMRPDLIPEELIEELKKLQDNVPPFSFSDARIQIESELGRSLDDAFSSFGETPLGTASIGQVYAASLHAGEDVVVQIQRPGIKTIIESDLDLMYLLSRALARQIPQIRFFDPVGIVSEFDKAIRKELDYTHELRSAVKFGEAFRDDPEVTIPKIYKSHSAKKILTMERIHGVKITHAAELGSDPKKLARIALQAVLKMVFRSGFFHADPHPGNIFALAGNRIAFLDLGMVGRLDESMRFRLAALIVRLLDRDSEEVSRILLKMGLREAKVNLPRFRHDVGGVMDKVLGLPISEINFSEIIKDLMDIARIHQIKIPNEYTLMGKALLTVEGVGKALDPDLDIEGEVAPFIRELLIEQYSPKRITRSLIKRAADFYHWSHELPAHVMTILDDLQGGHLKVNVEQTNQPQMLRNLERISGKLTAALIISSLILSSALFITFSHIDYHFLGIPVTLLLGGAGYVAAAILGLRLIRDVVKFGSDDE
ncbi:MAG: AarF/ABC1/UbiB kinase family protein [Candidatus Riflebacteria bacterium]|nr:AarF/ABC1/UbiB kinase family protein [Candidatus Riflebacteria bacterium]